MVFEPSGPLPLSQPDFAELRRDGAVYVDKTAMLFELCRSPSMIFLARPRGFGKTLLVSAFESLFRHGLRDFKGLDVADRWRDGVYPVMRLDFALAQDFLTFEEFDARLEILLARAMREAGFAAPAAGAKPSEAFDALLAESRASSLVLLIDNCDAPLAAHLGEAALLGQVCERLSKLYAAVEARRSRLRFLFMTGATKLAGTGIFKTLASARDISLEPAFGELLGFTADDILESFEPYVGYAAGALKKRREELLGEIERIYAGYCFDREVSSRVACPDEILRFFDAPELGVLPYWCMSGMTRAAMEKLLGNHPLGHPLAFSEEKRMALDAPDAPQAGPCSCGLPLEALLFQMGYLTIREASGNEALLGYPTDGVARFMARLYSEKLLGGKRWI